MTTRSLISLGANLGNPRENLISAARMIADHVGRSHVTASQLYRTPAIGGPTGQDPFFNAVLAIDSELDPFEIWHLLRDVESSLGRFRQVRWEARRIDLDVLLTDGHRIWTPHFKVPHPRMCMRSFILGPASEIVPDWIEPVTGWTIQRLANHLSTARPTTILVIGEDRQVLVPLQQALVGQPDFQFELVPSAVYAEVHSCRDCPAATDWLNTLASQVAPKLVVAAVASPDPASIAWEDFSRPWARWLQLTSEPTCPNRVDIGPRYLLAAHDLHWALHELHAAHQAMQCMIEPTSESVFL